MSATAATVKGRAGPMRRLAIALASVALLGALAPGAAADQIDGHPLRVTADGTGRLQITDVARGGATMFSEFEPGMANAGLEVVEGTDYIPFNGNRTAISGPTLSTVGPAQVLTSTYFVGLDLQVTETLSSVDGERTVDASYTFENVTDAPVTFRAAENADLAVGADEFGRGFLIDHAGARTLGGWTPEGGLAALVEQTPWTSYETGFFKDVFDHFGAGPMTGRVDPRLVDDGVGAQWAAQTLAPGATATFTVRWLAGADEQVNTSLDDDDGACTDDTDGCTVREALVTASTAGQIVTVPDNDYALVRGTLVLDHDLTVLGGSARFAKLHGIAGEPVVSLPTGVTADLRSLMLTDGGGGIATATGSTLRLSGSIVAGNQAADGAGIHAAGELHVERSTISGNTASRDGGGMWLSGAPATIENSTLSGNTATRNGGAIWAGDALGLTNVTIADNGAAGGGGVFEQVAAEKTDAINALFARNDGGHCAGTAGAVRSTSSLYDDHSCALGSTSGDRFPDDPRLGVLRGNGGDTDTLAPEGGSDALDHASHASCPAVDQRGEPRSLSCDIGAVEGTEPGGQLRVFTDVVNDADGHATAGNFTTHIRAGETEVAAHSGNANGDTFVLPGGTYRLAATGHSGYTFRYSGACAADGTFTMPPDGLRSCTVTADDPGGPLGTLRVTTIVHNTGGGVASASAFMVHVRSGTTDVPGSPAPGTSQRDYRLDVGTYTVSVDAPAHYNLRSCPPVTVTAGATAACSIDAYDFPPLIVSTQVTNDDGGRRSAQDFIVHVRSGGVEVQGSPAPGHARLQLDPGPYAVSVDAPAHYTVTLTGACQSGTVILATSGAFCIIEANDQIRRPRPHHSVNLAARSGTVKVKAKGSRSFVTLADDLQVPLGSIVDTRKGSVRLFAADGHGRVTHADVSGGMFKAGQTQGRRPFTVLTLAGRLGCRRPRQLTVDGSGRFGTRGAFSAATTRAARWRTRDTCTSTTTTVSRGAVAVRDLARHRTVRVRAGHAYVARKR